DGIRDGHVTGVQTCALPISDRAAASAQICQRLQEQAVWKEARSILFYHPMPDEPDVHPLFASALAEGKTAVLPRYSTVRGDYERSEERRVGKECRSI